MTTKTEILVGRRDRTHLTISRDRMNPESTIFVNLLDNEDILLATARVCIAADELQAGTVTRYSLQPANLRELSVPQRIFGMLTWERADKVRKQLY